MIFFWRYQISKTARVGMSIILSKELIMHSNSYIGNFSVVRNVDKIEIGEYGNIGHLNYITGLSTVNKKTFQHVFNRRCELVVGGHASITSRHFIDCNGGVYIGDFTTVAGIRSQILTHSIDLYRGRQDAAPVKIGKYCFIGTGTIILSGSILPNFCILGAGSLLKEQFEKEYSIYAGVPARMVKDLKDTKVEYFMRKKGFVR